MMNESASPTKSVIIVVSVVSTLVLTSTGFLIYQKFKSTKISELPTPISQSSLSPTPKSLKLSPTPDLTADWKTYTNSYYLFQTKYPKAFGSKEDFKKEDHYDSLIFLSSSQANITIKAINDVDVYGSSKPGAVAKREALDSGLAYSVTDTTISGYAAAITTLNSLPKQSIVATIAHPTRNLFIQISSDGTKEELNQILSTFKFFISDEEKLKIDSWIQANNLNIYGDAKDRMYAGGTPLFNEATGEKIDRYDYIVSRHPDRPWNN